VLLLSTLDEEEKANTMLLQWRTWFHRTNIMHGDGSASIHGSYEFLRSYATSISTSKQIPSGGPSDKGKRIVNEGASPRTTRVGTQAVRRAHTWKRPPEGWVKLNPGAGYYPNTGKASTGIVVRDIHGRVLISTWRSLDNIASVDEAEVEACLQGIRLARVWIGQPTVIATDCAGLIKALSLGVQSRAQGASVISEKCVVAQLLPEYRFVHVRREANQAAHELAQLAMRRRQAVVMPLKVPPDIQPFVDIETPTGGVVSAPDCNQLFS
jgi:ribonuclease HI